MKFGAGVIYMIAEKIDADCKTEKDGYNRSEFIQRMINHSLEYFSGYEILEEVYFEYYLHQEKYFEADGRLSFQLFEPFLVLEDCEENNVYHHMDVLILQTMDGESMMGYLRLKPLYMRPADRVKYNLYRLIL